MRTDVLKLSFAAAVAVLCALGGVRIARASVPVAPALGADAALFVEHPRLPVSG